MSEPRKIGLGATWGQLNGEEQRASQIRNQAVIDIGRNLPVFPSTFSPCDCGRGGGRGGGPCLQCAQESLASTVGDELAARYVAAYRALREVEQAVWEAPVGKEAA